MRLWSLHPKYLDTKGLVALWREALLAKSILEGKTKGYKNHPQLYRFKEHISPLDSINQYLIYIFIEASGRGFRFNKDKIQQCSTHPILNVNSGQLEFEINHLLKKLKLRDFTKYQMLKEEKDFLPNPLFNVIKGDVEKWEIVKDYSY